MKILTWQEIGEAPKQPGIYAWYFAPDITKFDVEQITKEILKLKADADIPSAKIKLREFLNTAVFSSFREQPYTAQLHAPLKPRYEGTLEHQPALSEGMLDRILEEPSILHEIREALRMSAPYFASPLYIGMSDNLRSRLSRHKSLIEHYAEQNYSDDVDVDVRDQSFAREVTSRKIPYARLFAVANVVPGSSGSYIAIENILNRIHFPLLGRN